MTRRSPSLPPLLAQFFRLRDRSPGPVACLLSGALAASVGVGAFAALVMVLWISSPYPDSGPDGALHTATALWLLAHGVALIRTETLDDVSAPVALTPLLLVVLPLWLVYRTARDTGDPEGARPRAGSRTDTGVGADSGPDATTGVPVVVVRPPLVPTAWWGVVLGYLLVAGGVAFYADSGELRPSWQSAALRLPLLVTVSAAAGVRSARRRRCERLPPRARISGAQMPACLRWRGGSAADRPSARGGGAWRTVVAAGRAAVAGTVVLVGGGGLLAVVSLVWHGGAAQASFFQLTDGWSGRFAVLLLVLSLLPNAAVWGAAFALGPGFLLGTGYVVGPLEAASAPILPSFPLLAAVPEQAVGTRLGWAVVAVPVLAALTVVWFTVEAAAPAYGERDAAWRHSRTLLTVMEAAVLCGGAVAGLSVLAGGALGVETLSRFGPVWWQTGGAAAGWSLLLGVPGVVILRSWRLRPAWRFWRRSARATVEASEAVTPVRMRVPVEAPVVTAPVVTVAPGGGDLGADGPKAEAASVRGRARWWRLRRRRTEPRCEPYDTSSVREVSAEATSVEEAAAREVSVVKAPVREPSRSARVLETSALETSALEVPADGPAVEDTAVAATSVERAVGG